jgi:hypothetical protein
MSANAFDFENRPVLEESLLRLKSELLLKQTPAHDPATYSIEQFAKAPAEKQKEILTNITTYLRILAQTFEPEIDRSPRAREVARLKWSLKCFGLKTLNDDVFNAVSENDVIEVYNLQGIQLYRNMMFFKVCSYSLLDLSINSWDQLYDKPSTVVDATMKVIERLFTSGTQPIPYNIGTYLQKEKFHYAKQLKTLKVEPKYIVPLVDFHSGQPAGAFSTYHAEVIAEGDQSLRYNTI